MNSLLLIIQFDWTLISKDLDSKNDGQIEWIFIN